MMRFNSGVLTSLAFLLMLIYGCRNTAEKEVSKIDLDIQIQRFEEDLFSMDIYRIDEEKEVLMEKYPRFFPLFSNQVIEVGDVENPDFANRLSYFMNDKMIYFVSNRVKEVYPDLDQVEKRLTEAFKYYSSYFPNKTIPMILTHVSGFNQSIVVDDSLISISLDKYLGADEPLYDMLQPPYPQYIRKVMSGEKIPSDVMRALAITEYEFNNESENLLASMIYQGRSYYFVEQMMPAESDTVIWGYTKDQITFCKLNENSMWTYLVEQKLLFETSKFRIQQFTGDAPFTKDFSQDSPGRAVVWIGKQIVEKYVEETGVTLEELMLENNYQKILNLSKYNP